MYRPARVSHPPVSWKLIFYTGDMPVSFNEYPECFNEVGHYRNVHNYGSLDDLQQSMAPSHPNSLAMLKYITSKSTRYYLWLYLQLQYSIYLLFTTSTLNRKRPLARESTFDDEIFVACRSK